MASIDQHGISKYLVLVGNVISKNHGISDKHVFVEIDDTRKLLLFLTNFNKP